MRRSLTRSPTPAPPAASTARRRGQGERCHEMPFTEPRPRRERHLGITSWWETRAMFRATLMRTEDRRASSFLAGLLRRQLASQRVTAPTRRHGWLLLCSLPVVPRPPASVEEGE